MKLISTDIRLIKKPKNYDENHSIYFEPHYKNYLFNPELHIVRFKFYCQSAVLIDLGGKKEKSFLPFSEWGNLLGRIFWLKRLLKSFLNLDVRYFLRSNPNIYLVVNPMSNNYFHWITEVVPKMYLIQKKESATILMPSNIRMAYQLEILNKLKIKFKYFDSEFIFLKKAFYFSNFSEFPGYYSCDTIQMARNLLGVPTFLKNSAVKNPYFPVYISRRLASRRKIVNESEIIGLMNEYNIKIIDIENHSFNQIVNKFSYVTHIISIHGAGLTNMIFMKKGFSVFELLLENTLPDKCYYFLANACELSYSYQFCKSVNNSKDHIFTDYEVDVPLFKKNLLEFLTT